MKVTCTDRVLVVVDVVVYSQYIQNILAMSEQYIQIIGSLCATQFAML